MPATAPRVAMPRCRRLSPRSSWALYSTMDFDGASSTFVRVDFRSSIGLSSTDFRPRTFVHGPLSMDFRPSNFRLMIVLSCVLHPVAHCVCILHPTILVSCVMQFYILSPYVVSYYSHTSYHPRVMSYCSVASCILPY
jgi:hypothetical protein